MRVTRQYWTTATLSIALVVGAIVLVRPLLFVGAAMIAAWLLARQYVFVRALTDTVNALSLSQEVVRDNVVTDRPIPLSLAAVLDEPNPLTVTIEAGVPAAATADSSPTLTLESGTTKGETLTDLRWSIAGTFRFDPPTIVIRDPSGLFEERMDRGPSPTITVEPRGPRNIHVGKGGERIRQGLGEHESDPLEGGLEPAELREYMLGDPAKLIDWNATARLGSPHVRDSESETNRRTVLVLDHRESMTNGPEGKTKLDYARHAALAFVEQIQQAADPLGLYTVDDEGVAVVLPPASTGRHYATVRDHIHQLTGESDGRSPARTTDRRSLPRTRRIATCLANDDSAFATRLRSYAEGPGAEYQRSKDDPLVSTIRTHVHQLRGTTMTVIVTDDTNRTEVRDAALLARRGGDRVRVVLTPTVLFESSGFISLESAYERYSEFERFRRSLDRLNRISAMELAPGDRLATVLSVGRASTDGEVRA